MENLVKIFEENENARRQLSKAEKRFTPKGFYQQYKALQQIAHLSRCSLPLLSIATGCFALSTILQPYMPLYFGLALAALLLGLWERVKSLVVVRSCELFYLKSSGLPIILLMVALIFASGSAALSLMGSNELAESMDSTQATIDQQFEAEQDSLLSFYGHEIAKAKSIADDYFHANSYRGVITWTKDGSIAEHYRELSQVANQLVQQEQQALSNLRRKWEQTLAAGQRDYQKITVSFLVLVALIEVLIILANWFVVYFDYRIYREHEVITEADHRQLMLSASQIREFFQAHILPNLQQRPTVYASSDHAPAIGFKSGNEASSKHEKNLREQENKALSASSDLSNEAALIAAIRAGERDIRSLTKRFRMNISKVHSMIEKYGE